MPAAYLLGWIFSLWHADRNLVGPAAGVAMIVSVYNPYSEGIGFAGLQIGDRSAVGACINLIGSTAVAVFHLENRLYTAAIGPADSGCGSGYIGGETAYCRNALRTVIGVGIAARGYLMTADSAILGRNFAGRIIFGLDA